MKRVETDNVGVGYGTTLLCPRCGEGWLHHGKVEVYERHGEDSNEGLAVTINSEVVVRTSMTGNPSLRRNGLRIYFSCEICEDDGDGNLAPPMVMSLVQHKGTTYLEWESE